MIAKRFRLEFQNYRVAFVILLLVALSCPPFVHAGELTTSDVQHHNGRFTVHSSMLVRLPVSQVRKILTDFENLPRINSNIKTVNMLAPSRQGMMRMQLKSEVCALFICLDYRWVQEVNLLPSGDIVTHFDPALSDFREGWVRYQLLSEGRYTRLITDAILVPDFWFPPLIGPMLVKSKLRNEALDTVMGIETLSPNRNSVAPVRASRFVVSANTSRQRGVGRSDSPAWE